jgi:hypothetical protein
MRRFGLLAISVLLLALVIMGATSEEVYSQASRPLLFPAPVFTGVKFTSFGMMNAYLLYHRLYTLRTPLKARLLRLSACRHRPNRVNTLSPPGIRKVLPPALSLQLLI